MTTGTKARIAVVAAFVVVAAPLVIPKHAPKWLWDIGQIVFVLLLVAAAAAGAVLWERYGPNGCKLREAEFEAWRARCNAARADFDSAVADFKTAVNSVDSQETRIQVLDGGDR